MQILCQPFHKAKLERQERQCKQLGNEILSANRGVLSKQEELEKCLAELDKFRDLYHDLLDKQKNERKDYNSI